MKVVPNQDIINEVVAKGLIDKETYIDNIRRFEDVVKGRTNLSRRASIESYMKAVEFVTYRMAGNKITESYRKTFPDRVAAKDPASLHSAASIYAKGELVVEIETRAYLANHVLFSAERVQAMMELYRIGMGGDSEKNRVEALKAFVAESKKDEKTGGININMNFDGGATEALENTLARLADQQQKMIAEGVSTKEIIEAQLVQADDS